MRRSAKGRRGYTQANSSPYDDVDGGKKRFNGKFARRPLGSLVLIRDVIDDELEQAFSGKKSAQAALDSTVERGNRLLHQFELANPDR